jgi:hypothetical protein
MIETPALYSLLSNVINQYKSISILVVYFVIIGSLCFRCLSVIFAQNKTPRKHASFYSTFLFACLAVSSLVTTWYFMILFLMQSYRDWMIEQHPDPALSSLSKLRGWLDETYLFEQAWAAIVKTEPRFWWAIQIFGFASIWSVFLGIEGSSPLLHPSSKIKTQEYIGPRNHIHSIWIFMILGQFVAISFAANLSFLLVLLARSRRSKKPLYTATKETRYGFGPHFAAIISFACAALTRFSHGDQRFIIVLLMPHVMAFAPMTSWLKPDYSVYYTVILLATSLFAYTTWQAMANGYTVSDFAVALYEYPAVSSAGWDVIWCWISFTAWILVN